MGCGEFFLFCPTDSLRVFYSRPNQFEAVGYRFDEACDRKCYAHVIFGAMQCYDMTRDATFNMRSKADMSRLNLPHGKRQLKIVRQKN